MATGRFWVAWALLLAVAGCRGPTSPSPTATTPDPQTAACREGLTRALELEMARYQTWLAQANAEDAARYRAALAYLRDLQQHVQAAASPAEAEALAYRYIPHIEEGAYGRAPLPATRTLVLARAWVDEPLPAAVHYAGQTRSGPFYIATAATVPLRAQQPYRMTVRLLMPGTYPFPEFYVCIVGAEAVP